MHTCEWTALTLQSGCESIGEPNAQACIVDGTIATTTIAINIDLDDHPFIKQMVESLLYAVEYTRIHGTDVEALVLTH